MKIRKIVAVFMSVIMVCTVVFSVPASAVNSSSSAEFEYEVINKTEAKIVGVNLDLNQSYISYDCGYILLVDIPSTIDGYTVTSIEKGALNDNNYPVELMLPETISVIASETFYANNIIRVYIPTTVTSIEENAFWVNNFPGTSSVYPEIYGETDSVAYTYAVENDLPFFEIPKETSTTELEYWIDRAETELLKCYFIYEYDYEAYKHYIQNAIYTRDSLFSTQNEIDTIAYSLQVFCKDLELRKLIYNIENQMYKIFATYDSMGLLESKIRSAHYPFEYCGSNPGYIPTLQDSESMMIAVEETISSIASTYNNLVLHSEYTLDAMINDYYNYEKNGYYSSSGYPYGYNFSFTNSYGFAPYELYEIFTPDSYSQYYNTFSNAENVYKSWKLYDYNCLEQGYSYHYNKQQNYEAEFLKIIDSYNNLELNSYYTLKETIEKIQNTLNDEGYKYLPYDNRYYYATMFDNPIDDANYWFSKYEDIILENSIIYIGPDYNGYDVYINELRNKMDLLAGFNSEFERINSQLFYTDASMEEKCVYLQPIELGNISLDQDNYVTITDVLYSLKNIVGTVTFDEKQQYAGDMNGDGKLTLHDTILIQRKALESPYYYQ
ncbi:MAG: hypothetical protein UHK60_06610 [Acutalibacteraceae bacterium]|nr:hypothetical protein [Acutalibacteraceae bacterium]